MEIQPEVKVKSRERERERRRKREKDMGGARVPRNQAERLVRETGPRPLAPSFIVQKAFYTFDKTWRSMDNTKLCSVHNPVLSVYHFVYKRSQVIYIIFWPRGLLTLFGSVP